MSKKSTYKVLSVLILAILVLSACGQSPSADTPAQPAAPAAADGPEQPAAADMPAAKPSGKLVIWAQAANQDVWEQTVLEGFKAEYPDVEIEFVNYSPPEVANQVGWPSRAVPGFLIWLSQNTAALPPWLSWVG
jgi:ABC-type glycerol-3-phosphate transport system substrate-binding protein